MNDPLLAWLTDAATTTTKVVPPRRRIEDLPDDHPWAWTNQAACRHLDPDLFFPESAAAPEAVNACKHCPVLAPCRDWAIHHEDNGYWGGMSERARRRTRRALGITCTTNPDPADRSAPEPDEDDLAS